MLAEKFNDEQKKELNNFFTKNGNAFFLMEKNGDEIQLVVIGEGNEIIEGFSVVMTTQPKLRVLILEAIKETII